jgi:hypothetical protein
MCYGITTIKRVAVKVNHDLNQGAGAVYPRFAPFPSVGQTRRAAARLGEDWLTSR